MRELQFSKTKASGPAYLRIAETIRESIRDGQLRPAEALPSARHLARQFRVHRHTVMTALDDLIAEGWIGAVPRKGYFVHGTLPDSFFGARPGTRRGRKKKGAEFPQPARPLEKNLSSELEIKYSFLSGTPDMRLFPVKEFRSVLMEAFDLRARKLLSYGDPAGYGPFIEEIEIYLRRMRGVTGRRLVVTHGSQEALFLIGQVYLKPGDAAIVEGLGYGPALQALGASGAELIPVPVDESGMDVEKLENILKRRRFKLVYVTPHHQYPTTVTLPVSRRMKLLELAERYGFYILEDDYDHEFHYRGQPVPPLAATDENGAVLYVSTLSKVLSPDLRLGFMALPESAYQPLVNFRRIVTRQNDQLSQYAVALWMKSGGFERHLRRMRRHYEERRDVMVRSFEEARERGIDLDFKVPAGGMALWLDLKRPAGAISSALLKKSVLTLSENQFRMDDRGGTHLRLGFANQTPQELTEGLRIILQTLR